MKKEIKTIQAAFNMLDPFQRDLYEYAIGVCPNSSSYVKRLIQRDMESRGPILVRTEKIDINSELMQGLI